MKRLVLDASVAAKWFFNEPGSNQALKIAAEGPEWIVPDLFFPEMGNLFWKKCRRGEIESQDAKTAMVALRSLGIRQREGRDLIHYALELALEFQCTADDGLYLSVAIDEGCPLLTADRKFYNLFSSTALGEYLLWIEDV